MTTSTLKHTAPLAAVPSLPPLLGWVSVALHRIKAFQMHALEEIQEPSEQTYDPVPLVVTPIYTPPQEGDGYR